MKIMSHSLMMLRLFSRQTLHRIKVGSKRPRLTHNIPTQTKSLQQLTPHAGDPPGTAMNELRPGRTPGRARRLLENLSQDARSNIKNPTAHCTMNDISRDLACFGAEAGASRTGLCKLSISESRAPRGMVSKTSPKPTPCEEVQESTHRDVWEDATVRELKGLKVARTFTPCE